MKKGILFDYNGTLVFDSPLHERAWAEYLQNIARRPITGDEFLEYVHGRSNRDILTHFLARPLRPGEGVALSEEKEQVYRRLARQPGSGYGLVAGAADLFDGLAARGVPFGIATSSNIGNVDFYFEMVGLARWFSRDRVAYDDGVMPCKPAPDIYLQAAASLGLPPARCLVFEDSPTGIASAKAAGVGAVVGIAEGGHAARLRAEWGVDTYPDFTAAAADIDGLLARIPDKGESI